MRGEFRSDWDDVLTPKLDFPLVPLLYDWLNCLPDRFATFVDDDGKGDGGADIARDSISGVLYKQIKLCLSFLFNIKSKPSSSKNNQTIL